MQYPIVSRLVCSSMVIDENVLMSAATEILEKQEISAHDERCFDVIQEISTYLSTIRDRIVSSDESLAESIEDAQGIMLSLAGAENVEPDSSLRGIIAQKIAAYIFKDSTNKSYHIKKLLMVSPESIAVIISQSVNCLFAMESVYEPKTIDEVFSEARLQLQIKEPITDDLIKQKCQRMADFLMDDIEFCIPEKPLFIKTNKGSEQRSMVMSSDTVSRMIDAADSDRKLLRDIDDSGPLGIGYIISHPSEIAVPEELLDAVLKWANDFGLEKESLYFLENKIQQSLLANYSDMQDYIKSLNDELSPLRAKMSFLYNLKLIAKKEASQAEIKKQEQETQHQIDELEKSIGVALGDLSKLEPRAVGQLGIGLANESQLVFDGLVSKIYERMTRLGIMAPYRTNDDEGVLSEHLNIRQMEQMGLYTTSEGRLKLDGGDKLQENQARHPTDRGAWIDCKNVEDASIFRDLAIGAIYMAIDATQIPESIRQFVDEKPVPDEYISTVKSNYESFLKDGGFDGLSEEHAHLLKRMLPEPKAIDPLYSSGPSGP